jgi:restriction system protein
MQRVNAKQCLLVASGGFTKDAIPEARNDFFLHVTVGSGYIINESVKHYEQFEDELKAELPSKRIWTLVEERE